jgi:hypothetical protein
VRLRSELRLGGWLEVLLYLTSVAQQCKESAQPACTAMDKMHHCTSVALHQHTLDWQLAKLTFTTHPMLPALLSVQTCRQDKA